MPVLPLTIREIRKIQNPTQGQVDYFDTEVKGLYLRVGIHARTFFVKAVAVDPGTGEYRTVKEKIGRFGEVTPEQARQEALKRLPGLRTSGGAKRKLPTLAAMMETCLEDNSLKPSTVAMYRRDFRGKFPEWSELPLDRVGALAPDIVVGRFNQVKREDGPMAALNSFRKLQTVLNYARILYPVAVPRNPCRVLTDGKLWPKPGERTDCLRGNDFKVFHDGIQVINAATRDAFLFALYHGLRRSEAAGLRWSGVDFEGMMFTIPETKNKKQLYAPLSRQSLEILRRREAVKTEGDVFVFPARLKPHLNKSGHVLLTADNLRLRTGLEITPHGLRRSFVTIGKKLKLHEEVERLVNHPDSSITGKHYDCRDVDDLREPLQRIATEIERLMVHGVGAKVIEIGTAKQAA